MPMNPADWARFKNQTSLQDSLHQQSVAQRIVYRDWCVQLLVLVQRYGKACAARDEQAQEIYKDLLDHIDSPKGKVKTND